MSKKTINLLIEAEPEPELIRRFKKISPLITVTVLIVFIIAYSISLIYVNTNIEEYNQIKSQVDKLESEISAKKSSESIYMTSVGVLETIKRIMSKDTKIIVNTLPILYKTQINNVVITASTIDSKGPAGLNVKTSSIDTLENFIDELKFLEKSNNFKDIQAAGIVRETDGSYTLSINLTVNKMSQ
ncbi:hypothetical protein A2W14_01775 [Candidatus Gottesmanbacteria bacterium RBG_16_37_8]|uniref:PilN domain-containing protein n=1 Tax=Candidatus Gottesmanbacteria bacterium RBG_16_37_8 TaxID=1798371 RepID=A0A1F5YT06_9BACT|nr:MAG: hypothetical protein A2W14_01775 [Candidatus Gottesmanbacteria bacterium RBG_16_37_8]